MTIIDNIREYVEVNKIPRKQLASKINMAESKLSQTLNGKRKMSVDEYVSICEALCVAYDKFVSQPKQAS